MPNKATAIQKCWICGVNNADSGEHSAKASDLKQVLGSPTQAKPFYQHNAKGKKKVGSIKKSKILKPVRICAYCNSTRTQPYDRAWEKVSDYLHTTPCPIKDSIRFNSIFSL